MSTIEEIATNAFKAAVDIKDLNATLMKSYQNDIALMIKAALLVALAEEKRSSELKEKALKDKIDLLVKQINELKEIKSTATPSFASLFKDKSDESKQQRQQLSTFIADQNKNIRSRELSVIVVGLNKSSTVDDKKLVEDFFVATGLEDATGIARVNRLKSSKNKAKLSNSNIIQVSLSNLSSRAEILKKCAHHKQEIYKGVYVREDRTPEQQTEFNTTRTRLKKLNDQLAAANILDNPFRNVIHRRTGRICCIDVIESTSNKCYVFSSPARALSDYASRTAAPNSEISSAN
jgi:hypothetical protein